MIKPDRFPIFVFLFVLASWSLTVFFWFNNFDLAYIHGYIGIENTLHNVNLKNLIRGHQIINFFVYLIFGLRPWGYYLVANILHALVAVFGYLVFKNFFKDRFYSLLLALLVFVNFTYSNVLFEGTFNQYYSFILLTFLISVYLLQKRICRFFGLPILMILGFLFRETSYVLFGLVFFYVAIFSKDKDSFLKDIRYLAPLFVVLSIYTYFRIFHLGDLFSDLTDDAVQARISFIQSGNYKDYFVTSLNNFSRMVGEQTLSYPVLYKMRDFLVLFALKAKIYQLASFKYFIPLIGFLIFLIFFVIVVLVFIERLKIKKDKRRIVYFGILWFILLNFFMSLVLPFPEYVWNRNLDFIRVLARYNYYQIFGLVLFVGALFYEWRNKKFLRITLLFLIAVNFLAIQYNAYKIYLIKHRPARYFFTQVFEKYPDFPRKTVIYYNFFQVNNLRDWIYDLSYIFRKIRYPNSEFLFESSLAEVQKKYLSSEYELSGIYAFDLDEKGYFVDKTDMVRKYFVDLKEVDLGDQPEISLSSHNLFSNGRYMLSFEARFLKKKSNLVCNETLSRYSNQRRRFLEKASLEVGSKYGGNTNIFPYVGKSKLIDNGYYKDSMWQAEPGNNPDELVLDLGEERVINGFSWISNGLNANPNVYEIKVSIDGSKYKTVFESYETKEDSRIDYFEPIYARYIMMDTKSTLLGQPVIFYEIEANQYSEAIRDRYQRFDKLLEDAFLKSCPLDFNWGKIRITTSSGTTKEFPIMFDKDRVWKKYSFEIVNYEPFMATRTLLEDKLRTLSVFLVNDGMDYEFRNFKLVP